MKRNSQYALYKGEKLVEIGTKKELAELLKVRVETISFYTTPTHRKRSKNGYSVVKIEEEKMKGEILDIGTAQELAGNKKEIERLRRNCNLKELENKELIKKIAKQDMEIYYLKRRDDTLTAIEKSLPQRIETYKKKNAPKEVIKELQFIADMLMFEKEKLLNREVEENETEEDEFISNVEIKKEIS